jgi:UDP-N-acetylglucosamine--N-acetylmuramyl-(pentapeptide) pyrophosphoryl-undecaprenol N-acetylglucosamine transferase
MKQQNIFLMGGRTGGPLLPVIAISKELPEFTPIIVGVKGGFEQKYSNSENITFQTLPEAKLTFASFSNLSVVEIVGEVFNTILMSLKLIYSFLKSIYLLIAFRPSAILTSGSFLGVPMVFAVQLTNLLRITSTKVVVHQQDAKPSLSNKIIAKFADKITSYFPETAKLLGPKCTTTTNPINFAKFDNQAISELEVNTRLSSFVEQSSTLPILLIFGGGSGAFAINKWVFENIEEITTNFRLIHLTGALQDNSIFKLPERKNYYGDTFLTSEMPYVITKADLVICRAGMASIAELLYNKKRAFLIPIPYSHQEENAIFVKDYFPTLKQRFTVSKPGKEDWLNLILEFYPTYFTSIVYPSTAATMEQFKRYTQEIKELIK